MQIKQDPVTKLWCRADGAICMPPSQKFPYFRWTFGANNGKGYLTVKYEGKQYRVHRIVCRAFHGLPPEGKPEVDHIDRNPANNKEDNLRYSDRSLNNTNQSRVDRAFEKHGVRCCEDKKAYHKSYDTAYAAERQAQGLSRRKGSDGKWGWFPRIRPMKEDVPCM